MLGRLAHGGFRRISVAVLVSGTLAATLPMLVSSPAGATSGTAAKIVFTTEPAFTTSPGAPNAVFDTQPVVTVEDSGGATVSNTDHIKLTLTDGSGNPVANSGAALSCTSTDVAASGGVATFAGCKITTGGEFTLSATDTTTTGLPVVVSSTLDVSGPAQLAFTGDSTYPTTETAGSAWSGDPTVTVEDYQGNPISGSSATVLLGLVTTGVHKANGAVLTCTQTSQGITQVTAQSGVATFSGCTIDKAGTYQLVAFDSSDVIRTPAGAAFTVDANSASKLAFTGEPTGAPAGDAFTGQPSVTVEDTFGNATTSTATVTLAIKSGTGSSGAVLTCDQTSQGVTQVAAQNGVASFTGCTINTVGSDYRLTATATSLTGADSNAFSITSGGTPGLSFYTPPGSGYGGAPLSGQPAVTLDDAAGNPLHGSITLSLVTSTGGATSAQLTCDANPMGATNGLASFTGCSVDQAGNYKMVATSGALNVASGSFSVSTGAPAKVAFSTEPSDGTGGHALSPHQPVIDVTDAGGNPADSTVTLSLTSGEGPAGAALTCTGGLSKSTTSGTASFTGCAVDKIGSGYSLTATITEGAGAVSTAFAVTLGPIDHLAFVQGPSDGTGGSPLATQPIVAVEDAGGNVEPGDTSVVDLSLTPVSGPASAALTCTGNDFPASEGVAVFSGCKVDKAGSYELTATDTHDGLATTSGPFTVTPGPASQLVFTAQPGGARAGTGFTFQPVVAVADAGGNTVPTSTDAVSLAIEPGTGDPAGTLDCGIGNPVGAVAGVATFSGCAINDAAAGYVLRATDGGLSAESLPFPVLVAAPPTPLGVAPTGVPVAQTLGGSHYGINPTDVSDDVNSATGGLTFDVTDLRVAGIGEPLLLQRTYNSADTSGGVFGKGWSSLLDVSLSIVKAKTATLRGEDGQRVVFPWNAATNSWGSPPGARAGLSCSSKLCTVTRFDGVTVDIGLSSTGRWQITGYMAPDGQGLSFTWTSSSVAITVATTNARPYTVVATLNGSGQVIRVTTPAGRTVVYSYTTGLLTSVTDSRGGTWTYRYNAANLLTTETDPSGHVRLTAAYDDQSRVTRVSAEGSLHHTDDTFTYSPGQTTRSALVDARGTLVRAPYVDQYSNGVLVAQSAPWGGISRYSYDAQVNLIEAQDPSGWVEVLGYDAGNDLVSQSTPINSTSAATVTMTYDSQHRVLTQTDADGNTVTYVYNGPFVGQIRPPGSGNNPGTKFTYNKVGELVQILTPIGKQLYTYDAAGNQTSVVLEDVSGNPLNGPGTRATYDEAGDATSRTDANGNRTSYTYDSAGDLRTTIAPGPQTTTNVYDAAGDVSSVTDAVGNTTAYSWDETTLTRTSVTTPAGSQIAGAPSTQVYDPSGNLLVESNSAKRTTTHVFDATGREVSTTDPSNLTVHYTYDMSGNVVSTSDSAGDLLTQQFDSLNRMIRQVDNGAVSLTGYDPVGNVVSTTDPAGAVTTTTYNTHGKPATVSNAAGTTSYAYDVADDVVARTDPNGNVTTYTYDGAGRQTAMALNGHTTSYTYDDNGNVKTVTDPDGRVTTYTYNPRNLPTTTAYTWSGHPSLTVSQAYDALGRRIGMTDSDGTPHAYSYDLGGDLVRSTTGTGCATSHSPCDTFTFDYSQPGKIIETYPDATNVTYSVDDQQNLMSVESGTQGIAGYVKASYIRNQLRETTGISFSNGVLETRSLNQAGQVLDQSLQVAGTQVAGASFSYDSAGNPLSQVDTALGTTTTNEYGYDASERLTGFTTSSAPAAHAGPSTAPTSTGGTGTPAPPALGAPTAMSGNGGVSSPGASPVHPGTAAPATTPSPFYAYDATGNLVSSGPVTATYNASNELTSETGPAGTTTFTYDGNGDRVGATGPNGTTTYTYDAADHLVRVTTPSSTITYTYDGDGNRTSETVGASTTQFVWDTSGSYPRLAIERTSGGALVRRYIYGDGPVAMQTPTATYFYHLSPQGSVAELSDASGAIVAAYTYDGYGNVTTAGDAPPVNPLLFQGQYLDSATGLYDMRARSYDPTTGTFTQQDPLRTPVGVPSVSPYAFVGDRPTVLTDPTGETTSGSTGVFALATQKVQGTETLTYAKVATTAAIVAKPVLSKAASYIGDKISSAFTSATQELSSSTGEIAEAASEVAEDTGATAGAAAAEGGEEAAGLGLADVAKFAGPVLAVAGIALGAYLTVETCEHDSVSACVGAAVGTTVAAAFTVGCLVATEGIGAVVCGLAGAAISAGLQEVITRYGPQIAAGVVSAYEAAAAGVSQGIAATTQAFETAGNAISDVATSVGGAIATGLNEATTAISSGFQTAMTTLVDAGYSAAQLAGVLANTFSEGVNDAVAGLVSLGYQIGDIADALASTLSQTATQAVQILVDGFGYAVNTVANAVAGAYALIASNLDSVLATALSDAGVAVADIASALQSVYDDGAAAVATILNGLDYGVNQIADALQAGLGTLEQEAADVLQGLQYTADQVAGALQSVFQLADNAVATALQAAGYLAGEIAGALGSIYDDGAQAVATILSGLQYGATAVADALHSAFSLGEQAVAQVLQDVAYTATEVADALKTAFTDLVDTSVATFLADVGFGIDAVAGAIQTAFSDANQLVVDALKAAAYTAEEVAGAISDVLATGIADVASFAAGLLNGAAYAIDDIAGTLQSFFSDTDKLAAQILAGLSGITIDEVAGALQTVFDDTDTLAVEALQFAGYAISDIVGALQTIFGDAEQAIVNAMQAAGVALADLASTLESVFNQTADALGSFLQGMGISSSLIQTIGGALSSFGNDLQTGWNDFVSLF